MPFRPASSLARALNPRKTRALRTGTVEHIAGSQIVVRMSDGSVLRNVVAGNPQNLSAGGAVNVQWNEGEQPVAIGGAGAGAGGAARVVRLNIPQVDDFAPNLPDGFVCSEYYAAMMLNLYFNATPLPSVSTLYVGLMSRISSNTDYAEITSASVSNIKRAGKPRNTTEFPLVHTGREITNALDVGAGAMGAADSFCASGAGFASGFDVEGWGVFDAATGGNFWFGAKFDAVGGVVKRHVSAGDTFSIPAGGLRARFAPGGMTDFEARNYLNVTFSNMGFARTVYRVGLLMDAQGTEPSTSAFSNYKQARIPRNLATFPLITGKSMACALAIGSGASGTDNSFLSSLDVARLTQNIPIYGIGLYEDTSGPLCWVVPNTTALTKTTPTPPQIPAGRLILKLS